LAVFASLFFFGKTIVSTTTSQLTPSAAGASPAACNIVNATFLALDGFAPLRAQCDASGSHDALAFAAHLARIADLFLFADRAPQVARVAVDVEGGKVVGIDAPAGVIVAASDHDTDSLTLFAGGQPAAMRLSDFGTP
jgi:hypothetical protein